MQLFTTLFFTLILFLHSQPTLSPSSVSLYRVNTTNGNTCILIRTDGLLSIQYRNKLNEDSEADAYMPDNVGLSGKLLICFSD